MAEAEAVPASSTKKNPKKKSSKPKAPANHPKYSDMIREAISGLKERGGSSRQAILKYIVKHFNVGKDEKVVNQHLKMALRAGVKNNTLKQAKGTGASGSFRLGESKKANVKKSASKVKSPAKAKKPKVKKSPKKAAAKKPKKTGEKKVKKAKTPKKAKSPKAKKPKASKPKKPKAAKAKKSPKKTKK